MQKIPLPNKVELMEESDHKATLIVEPCFAGYGLTLGNAMRRVLLSSMPGAAVTSMRIKGVLHEFSTIPHVKEDVVEIILNLKQLRMKLFTDEPVKLELKVKGDKVIHAKDFEANSQVEIVNKDLKIAEMTDKAGTFELEVWVTKGRGFIATETRDKEKLEIGMIAIDSIFTPVKNVSYKVENVRVGQMTNFDKMILEVETDGTIKAKDAITQSADILLDHFSMLTENGLKMMKDRQVEIAKLEKEVGDGKEEMKEAESQAVSEAASEGDDEPKKKRGRPKKA